jgi:hypothetical protein
MKSVDQFLMSTHSLDRSLNKKKRKYKYKYKFYKYKYKLCVTGDNLLLLLCKK